MSAIQHIVIMQNIDLGGSLALSRFVTELIPNLRDPARKLSVIVSSSKAALADDINVIQTNTDYNKLSANAKYAWRGFFALRTLHQTNPIHIVHCFYPNSSVLAAFFYKVLINRQAKILYEIRSPWVEMAFAQKHVKNQRILKWIMHVSERLLLHTAQGLVLISEGLQKYYSATYGQKKNCTRNVIPSGVTLSNFESIPAANLRSNPIKSLPISESDIVVGYVGSISASRQIVEFFESLDWKKLEPRIKFILVGEGDATSALKSLIHTPDLEHRIFLTGPVHHDNIGSYLQQFDYGWCPLPDIFVYRHSFPLKILEYLAAGLPVLASSIQAHQELKAVFPNHIRLYEDTAAFSSSAFTKQDKRVPENIVDYDYHSFSKKYNAVYQTL